MQCLFSISQVKKKNQVYGFSIFQDACRGSSVYHRPMFLYFKIINTLLLQSLGACFVTWNHAGDEL